MSVRVLIITITIALFSPIAALACPDVDQAPEQEVAGSYDDFYMPQEFPVSAGGGHLLSRCFNGFRGRAVAGPMPNFSVNVHGLTDTQNLILLGKSQCDIALLVYNEDNQTWQYDDNGNGNHEPLLLLSGEQGRLLVWIVTANPPPAVCDAIFHVETL